MNLRYINLKESILSFDWDVLVILDACRYDVFSKVYRNFFEGKLYLALSPATRTVDFLKAVFRGRYDNVVYVSANPIINSRVEVWGFNASRHFSVIIDVWDWGWDEEYGSVPPWEVNESAIKAIKSFRTKKIIIHYMQPHAPYMPISYMTKQYRIRNPFSLVGIGNITGGDLRKQRKTICEVSTRFVHSLMRRIEPLVPKWIPRQSLIWKMRKILNMPPQSPEEIFYRTFNIREIRLLYELNLRFVLKYVNELIQNILDKYSSDLRIVITSDHGELLGERGEIGHDVGWNLPLKYKLRLHMVPWFEVKKPLQVPRKWYGNEPFAEKYAKYFEDYERKSLMRKYLRRKIQQIRQLLSKQL